MTMQAPFSNRNKKRQRPLRNQPASPFFSHAHVGHTLHARFLLHVHDILTVSETVGILRRSHQVVRRLLNLGDLDGFFFRLGSARQTTKRIRACSVCRYLLASGRLGDADRAELSGLFIDKLDPNARRALHVLLLERRTEFNAAAADGTGEIGSEIAREFPPRWNPYRSSPLAPFAWLAVRSGREFLGLHEASAITRLSRQSLYLLTDLGVLDGYIDQVDPAPRVTRRISVASLCHYLRASSTIHHLEHLHQLARFAVRLDERAIDFLLRSLHVRLAAL